MKRLLLIAFIIVMILFASKVFGVEFRRAETFEDAFDASCRVSVSGARGSGTFIGVSGSKAYILTNYHVVTSMKNATLDFWTNGRKESIRGVVDWRYYDANIPCDFARVVVDANELKKIDPPYVALGGADARPGVNSFIISSGAPDGRFTQSWKGHILEYYNDKTAVFTPPPVPGQSGSGICEFVDGELFVTGVLTWLLGEKGSDDSKGGAIPIANLFVALNRRPAPASYDDESPIPPNASECAVENSHAIEFYSQDCPACKRVEPMIKKLVDEGVLTRVNTDDDDGFNLAQRYGVNELPTIVVLLNDAKVKTITYKDMLEHGAYRLVMNEIDAINEKISQKNSTAQEQKPKTPPENIPPPVQKLEPYGVDEPNALLIPPTLNVPLDFRSRSPVHEEPMDSGFFEDSDRIWKSRGKSKDNKDDKEKEDDEKDPGIGKFLQNDLTKNFRNSIEGLLADFSTIIQNEIGNVYTSLTKGIDAKIKELAGRLVWTCFALMILASLIADGLKLLIRRIIGNVKIQCQNAIAVYASQLNKTQDVSSENAESCEDIKNRQSR